MAPKKHHHHSKKKQPFGNTKKNNTLNSGLDESTTLGVVQNKDSSNGTEQTLVQDPTTTNQKQDVAVAFSLGSEHATVTLLPKHSGEYGQIIANEDGERHIPCIVSYVGDELIAGTAAKAQMIRNLSGTARFFVPMIGLKYDDEKVQAILPFVSVPVEADEEGYPRFILSNTLVAQNENNQEEEPKQDQEKENQLSPTTGSKNIKKFCSVKDLMVVLFKTLKQSAESYTGQVVSQCFVSYPMDFTPIQIDTLKQSAEATGILVRSMISEPMAALLAFQQHHLLSPVSCSSFSSSSSSSSSLNLEALNASTATITNPKDGLWFLVDVGALFTRFMVVNVSVGLYTILKHTSFLNGGLHLDQILSDYFSLDFEKKHPGQKLNPQRHFKAYEKLRLASELTRIVLSSQSTANCHVEAFLEGMDYIGTLNRMRFESLTRSWRTLFETKLTDFLESIPLDSYEVQRIVGLGGVIKTPRFISLLQSKFENATFETGMESDVVVALGTALHSLQSNQFETSFSNDTAIPTSTPHLMYPLGLVDQQGHFIPLISKASPLPLSYHVVLTPPHQPTCVLLKLAEGRELYVPPPLSDDEDADGKDTENEKNEIEPPSSFLSLNGTTFSSKGMNSNFKKNASMDASTPSQSKETKGTPPLYDLEPAYEGTVVSECVLQLESGIDKIYLVIQINEINEATVSAQAYNDTTQAKHQLTFTF